VRCCCTSTPRSTRWTGSTPRATGQSSPLGYFYDHFLDSLVLVLLLFSVSVRFSLLTPFFLLLFLLRVMLNAVGFLTREVTGELHLPPLGPVLKRFATAWHSWCWAYGHIPSCSRSPTRPLPWSGTSWSATA
jgi:hypothetical protein